MDGVAARDESPPRRIDIVSDVVSQGEEGYASVLERIRDETASAT